MTPLTAGIIGVIIGVVLVLLIQRLQRGLMTLLGDITPNPSDPTTLCNNGDVLVRGEFDPGPNHSVAAAYAVAYAPSGPIPTRPSDPIKKYSQSTNNDPMKYSIAVPNGGLTTGKVALWASFARLNTEHEFDPTLSVESCSSSSGSDNDTDPRSSVLP